MPSASRLTGESLEPTCFPGGIKKYLKLGTENVYVPPHVGQSLAKELISVAVSLKYTEIWDLSGSMIYRSIGDSKVVTAPRGCKK